MVPAVTFTEDWFDETQIAALQALYARTTGVGDIVEVGSWEGRSTVALANVAHPDVVHAVDTWRGCTSDDSGTLAAGRDVYAAWCTNVAELTAGNVVAHRMGWREFFTDRTDPIRFLFIDAEHTYREVFDNIRAALPLMAAGSVMCGDDAGHPPVSSAVIDALGQLTLTGGLWHWEAP